MQEIILSFDRNDIIMKYEWWWWLKDEEYTKNSIGSQVLEWFIPQYANLNLSLIFPALDNNRQGYETYLGISISGTRHRNQVLHTEDFCSV